MLFLKINCNQQTLKALTFVGAFCLLLTGFSQTVTGKLLGNQSREFIYLSEVIGNKSYKIDSCKITSGDYRFNLQNKPVGYYQLSIQQGNGVEIIYNEKDIVINFADTILQNNLVVLQSEENNLLWSYKYYSRTVQKIGKTLTIEQSYLEKGGELWQKLQRQRDSLDIAKRSYLKQLCEEHPESLFSKLVGATIRPIYSSQEEQKNHFFDNIDFSDPVVVRSSILPSAMMEFFQLHTEYNEGGFQRSIDKILGLASAHDEVYEFCLNFILDLFNRVGPDIVFQYVVETYLLDGGCSEANVSEHISALAENYRVLQTGNKAPFFIATTIDNDSFVLEQHLSKNKYTVLFFWSSHCAFCTETTPQLIDWKKQNPNVSVVGISLDNNKEELDKYLTKKTVPWENICDYKGWKSDIVLQYKIHKTPSFYVLDSKGVIVSKPKDMSTLSRLNMDKVK